MNREQEIIYNELVSKCNFDEWQKEQVRLLMFLFLQNLNLKIYK